MVTSENASDEILTLDRPSDHRARSCQETRAVSSRLEISQEANPLPYIKANEHIPDEHKTLEQRIADIEFNLKKLREEIIGAYIS